MRLFEKLVLEHLLLIIKNQKTIMATQEEAAQALQGINAQLAKANTEIQAKIQALTDAAANADNVSPALQAAIDDLLPAAQQLDDIVPDAPATTEGSGDAAAGQ